MRAYRLLDEGVARQMAADIRREDWPKGVARGETTKKNLELVKHSNLVEIRKALTEHPLYTQNFVTKIWGPKFNWYRDDGEYRIHTDAAYMDDVRTDLACTIFLTDDYEGGELVIDGKSVKGKPGIAVVYECWKPHWVNPVTSGDRISAITWMQSLIPEKWKRDLLNQLHEVTVNIGEQEQFAKLGSVHEKLVKHWSK